LSGESFVGGSGGVSPAVRGTRDKLQGAEAVTGEGGQGATTASG